MCIKHALFAWKWLSLTNNFLINLSVIMLPKASLHTNLSFSFLRRLLFIITDANNSRKNLNQSQRRQLSRPFIPIFATTWNSASFLSTCTTLLALETSIEKAPQSNLQHNRLTYLACSCSVSNMYPAHFSWWATPEARFSSWHNSIALHGITWEQLQWKVKHVPSLDSNNSKRS